MKKSTTRTLRASGRLHRTLGVGVRAGRSWPRPVLTLAVLLLAVATLGGVFAVAQAQQADGTMDGVTLASDAPGALTVSWETPSPAPTDYRLRWAPVESGFLSWKDDNETDRGNAYPAGDATSLTLSGLPEGTEYKLQVRARYHKGGYKKRPWSGPWAEASALVMSQPPQVSATRSAPATRSTPAAPSAPNLAATAVTPAGDVLVVWLNPSDDSITGYQVLRGPAAGSLAVIEEDTGSSGTSYTDTSAPAGQTHTYAVKARNAEGLSPLSNTLTATVPAAEAEEELTTARHESDENTLVSNLDQAAATLSFPAAPATPSAQQFTTGNNPKGYHATEVDLYLRRDSTDITTDIPDPVVTIQGDNSGIPDGIALFTFTTASAITNASYQLFTFTTGDRNRLLPNTRYWLHVATSTAVEMEIQSTESDTEDPDSQSSWEIRDGGHFKEGANWLEIPNNNLRLEIRGHESDGPTLVSNFGQTDGALVGVSQGVRAAQAFVAGPGLAGFGYRFQGIQVAAQASGLGVVLIPAVRASLHSDASGLPGSRLHTLTLPGDFASTETFADYTVSAPPGTILRGGARYWVVFEIFNNTLTLKATNSAVEDQGLDGWSIDNQRYSEGTLGWVRLSRVIKLAVLGEPAWMTDEPAGEDFPGADFNAHETTGVVTPGTASSGDLTAGLDRDYGLTGDYWYLDTQRGHSYRVEVTFGASPNNNTGGSAGIEFIDPDHDNYPDASGCCESDHNRDDGHTFVHFTHSRQSREWNNRYLLHVAAYDQLNSDSSIYNGPYTITMTDITGTREFVSNLYQEREATRTNLLGVGAARQYAMSFETGYNAAGYKLDRIQTFITHGGHPQFSLYSNTNSSVPGTKLCDFRNPPEVQHHVVWSAGIPATTFLATDCAEITLMPTDSSVTFHTYYWIVMEGTNYRLSGMDSNDESAYEPGWRIGDLALTKTTASWFAEPNSKAIPIGVWLSERYNPLSVSLEVTSDPTRGTDSDTYGLGDVITFEVKFTEAVTITGAPRLRFKISGTGDDYAPYLSGSGTDTLVFAYTVLATDADANGIFLYNRPLSYPDAAVDTIVAVDDNLPVFDNITGKIITLPGHKIDGTITN